MNRTTPATQRGFRLDELDAWVLEEVEALGLTAASQTADPVRLRSRQSDPRRPWRDGFEPPTEPFEAEPSLSRGRHPPRARNRDRHAAEKPAPRSIDLFDEAETGFIEQSVTWLSGRPNADMVLEEIWRLAVAAPLDGRNPSAPGADRVTDVMPTAADAEVPDADRGDEQSDSDGDIDGGPQGESERDPPAPSAADVREPGHPG
jgi:hypothetical protein